MTANQPISLLHEAPPQDLDDGLICCDILFRRHHRRRLPGNVFFFTKALTRPFFLWNFCLVASLLHSLNTAGQNIPPAANAFVASSVATTTVCRISYRKRCPSATSRLQQSQQQSGADISTPNNNPQPPTVPISFELGLGNENIPVTLSSPEDIPTTAKQISDRFGGQYNVQDIAQVLQQSWDAATMHTSGAAAEAGGEAPPAYSGPTPLEGRPWHAECTIELPSGLVLELGPSTIGEDAGLGLFVRQASGAQPVLQTQGSAFCGYGPCLKVTDTLEGLSDYQRQRTFEFILSDSLGSYVWFNGQLQTIWDAMQQSQATAVRSHFLDQNENGELYLAPDPTSPCYMVPPEERLDPRTEITIQTIGHMCNDLAGGAQTSKEDYDTKSSNENLLVLVPRVEVKDNGIIEPSGMPILTLAKTIFVANTNMPMEVGLRYGPAYWNSAG